MVIRLKTVQQLVAVCAIWPLIVAGQGTLSVGPSQSGYFVRPNESVAISVVIDATIPAGLFSYGVRLEFDPAKLVATATQPVMVPMALNFNGVEGIGALIGSGNGWLGVKGTVDISALPLQAYSGTLLATFLLADLTGVVGETYEFDLTFFNTLGASETIFVDGLGRGLDDRISFGSGFVTIVPEPSTLGILAVAGMMGLGWWQGRRAVRRASSQFNR